MAMPPARRPQGAPAPAPGLLRRIDAFARLAFPGFSTAFLMVLAAAPINLPSPVFAVALPCVGFWSVFRPGSMMPPSKFSAMSQLSATAIVPPVPPLFDVPPLPYEERRVAVATGDGVKEPLNRRSTIQINF